MGKESWAREPKTRYGTSRVSKDQCSNCKFVYEKQGKMFQNSSGQYEYDYSTHYCLFSPPSQGGPVIVRAGSICGQYVENESEKYDELAEYRRERERIERAERKEKGRKEKERKERERQAEVKESQEVSEPEKKENNSSSYVPSQRFDSGPTYLGPAFCWDSYFNISTSFDEAFRVKNIFLRCIAVLFSCIIVPINIVFIAAITIFLSVSVVYIGILTVLFIIGIFTPIQVTIDLTDIGLDRFIFNK